MGFDIVLLQGMDDVEQALSAEYVRPLTDKVLVGAPDAVNYALQGRWFATTDDATLLANISRQVDEAVEAYRQWQSKWAILFTVVGFALGVMLLLTGAHSHVH